MAGITNTCGVKESSLAGIADLGVVFLLRAGAARAQDSRHGTLEAGNPIGLPLRGERDLEGLPVVPNPGLRPAPPPAQRWQQNLPSLGRGPAVPGAPSASLHLGEKGAWIPGLAQVARLQEGTGSKVEGFELVGGNGSGFGEEKDIVRRSYE